MCQEEDVKNYKPNKHHARLGGKKKKKRIDLIMLVLVKVLGLL